MFGDLESAAKAFSEFYKAYRRIRSTAGRWVMMAPNGQNKKERKRNQTMLKGRRCRTHKGGYPTRGKGRTARGRRG